MVMKGGESPQTIGVKMCWNNRFNLAVQGVGYPLNQFFGTGTIGRSIKNNRCMLIGNNQTVARHVAKIVGLQVGGVHIGVFCQLLNDQTL